MKKNRLFFIVFMIIVFSITGFSTEKNLSVSGRVKFFGSVFLTDNTGKYFNHDSGDFGLKRLETRLKIAGNLNDRISYNLRFDGFSNSGTLFTKNSFPESGILSSPVYSEYFELNLYEANIMISDFLIDNLDLTIGKQRISWGTADKIGVMDNLNPIDFANFFTFDPDYAFEKRPQTALNFEYYTGDNSKIQFIWLMQHQVSPLPYGYTLLTKQSMKVNNIEVSNNWRNNIKDSNFGIRFSTNLFNIDFGFSFYNGNISLPIIKSYMLSSIPSAEFFYGKEKIVGTDFSTSIGGASVWGEAAYIIPDDSSGLIQVPVVLNNNFIGVRNINFSLFEKGFFKYVIGGDYNFAHGFYINFQYLHGFFDEFDYSKEAEKYFMKRKGEFFGEISDYIIPDIEYKFHGDDYKIKLSGIIEISDKTSWTLTPQIELRIADGLILSAGGFFVISGDETKTKFGEFKKDKLFYLSLKIDF